MPDGTASFTVALTASVLAVITADTKAEKLENPEFFISLWGILFFCGGRYPYPL